MSFPRYPEYKDSGVEWLGEVPEHWDVQLVKNLASIVNGYPFDSTLFDAAEGSPLIRIRDLNKSEAETFYKGDFVETAAITSDDVLIGMDGDFNVGRWRGVGRALLNQRMCCIRGKSKVLTRLLEYTLPIRLKAINDVTYATTVKHLASSQVEKILVAMPSDVSEQTQIAAFLDRETAKIDELVAEQRRLMALLKEKRQAVISHAVTRGLNPNAPMKPSGIEWLGDVPEHWELLAMKRLFRLVVESAPDDNDHELLSLYTEIGVRPRKSLEAKGNKATTTDGYWMVKKGDLIVNKLLAWMGAIGISDYDGVTSPAYDILRQRVHLEPRYYDYLLRCGICFTEFRRYSRGIMDMRLRLYFDELGQFLMPYPSEKEQREIVAFLQQELSKFDTLTTEAQRAIDLLQERRTALISAAVTGQIDVRGVFQ